MRPLNLLAAGLALWPTLANARSPFSATFGIGAQYDSNISIEEADIPTRRGDYALLTQASVSITPLDTRSTSLRFGYSLDDERNAQLSDVNITIHALSAGVSHRFGKAMSGADYQFSHVLLGGKRYLDIHTASPSLSAFVSRNLFVRVAGTYQQKNFVEVDPLDATTMTVGVDGYRFFAKRRGHVAISLRADHERTRAEQYRFDAQQASVRVQIPVHVGKALWKARVGYAFQNRDYLAPFPTLGEARHETRSTITAGLEIPVIAGVTLRPQGRYVDRRSNLAFYDYREHVLSLTATLKL